MANRMVTRKKDDISARLADRVQIRVDYIPRKHVFWHEGLGGILIMYIEVTHICRYVSRPADDANAPAAHTHTHTHTHRAPPGFPQPPLAQLPEPIV